jgi:hypothetical protein
MADCDQGGSDLFVSDQALEGMTGHDGEIELAGPGHRCGSAVAPLDAAVRSRHCQYRLIRINPAQSPSVFRLAGMMQERTGPASDVQDRFGIANKG